MPLRIIAIIAAYNEADVIVQTVGDLIAQGVEVYLIDHASTDQTVELAARHLGRGLIHIERFPEESGFPVEDAGRFALESQLRRKEQLSSALAADWFIHADADELRESPWLDCNLGEAIARVDALGYNAIDFQLFNFRPVDDRFSPGDDLRAAFPYWEPAANYDEVQIRAWKRTATPVDLASEGGHEANFPDRRVFPLRFVLRHYPIRSQAHGERKIFEERRPRFFPFERERYAWHVQYDGMQPGDRLIHDTTSLRRFDPVEARQHLQRP
jgi:glycosyltransferase involved in cell wall biosynthesis